MSQKPSAPATVALADTLYRVPRSPGIVPLQTRGPGGAALLSSWRLLLERGASADFERSDEESILVVERGRASLDAGGRTFHAERAGIFEEPATALYLPPGEPLQVRAETAFEAVIVSAPAKEGGTFPKEGGTVPKEGGTVPKEGGTFPKEGGTFPKEGVTFPKGTFPKEGGTVRLVTPAEVKQVPRGRGAWAREVHDIFVADPHPQRLLVGETFNPPGHWSSFPPHKHDGRDGEPYLEEVYIYALDPASGFAQQMLYTSDGDAVVHVVRDGDAVLLPYGYHPVCAPPGYRLRYLWALAGDARRLALHEDPAHRFIHDLEDP